MMVFSFACAGDVKEDPDLGRRFVYGSIQRNAQIYQSRLPYARVRVIPRVGYDVHVSCGMFFAPEGPTPV